MKYLGNIVTDGKKKREDYIKVVQDVKDIDVNIPTLIIGWDNVKNRYPDADILTPRITDNIFWTYRFNEKNKRYKEDLANFMTYIKKKMYENVKYEYYSISLNGIDVLRRRLNSLKGNGFFYVNYNMIYIFSPKANKVVGVNIEECNYVGIKRTDIIIMINQCGITEIMKENIKGDFKTLMYEKPYITPYLALISN